MTGPVRLAGIAIFALKFILIVTALLFLWWWKVQPLYAGFVGQVAGAILRFAANIPLDAMEVEVDESGVLSTKTVLVYLSRGKRYPIDIAYLVANIPPYCALILATSGLGLWRTLKVLATGLGILAASHVLFLVFAFVFAGRIEGSSEIPTAVGLFLMTLPFVLWIVFAYWDKLATLLAEPESASGGDEKAPPESTGP